MDDTGSAGEGAPAPSGMVKLCAYCDREWVGRCELCERAICNTHAVIWTGSFWYCRNCYFELRMSGHILPDELNDQEARGHERDYP